MALNWFKNKNKSEKSEKVTPQEASTEPVSSGQPPSQEQNEAVNDKKNSGFIASLKRGLEKTRDFLNTDIEDLFKGKNRVDEDMLEEIEEMLITSDIGVQTVMDLMDVIDRKAPAIESSAALKQLIKQEILKLFESDTPPPPRAVHEGPHIVMVVGVNGVGKTTTIGKLAAKSVQDGQRVLIAAADTFRAAAVEQLAVWAERAGADFVRHKDHADPAAVAYDSVEAALSRGIDKVYIDTAGRLHTKVNLMEELKKIQRSIGKKMPAAPHEVLLVLDATTGQNAISQARMFHDAIGLSGLILTKLDGTAKGGIVISICRQLKLPLLYIGVGESIEDLQPFDPRHFVDALF